MKAPNGYGGISKQSGRRRKPYVVRLTIGHNEKGYPIYKILGYFKTRYEANLALADYHKQPYDLDLRTITVNEVFQKAHDRAKNLSQSLLRVHKYTFNKHIAPKIGNIPYIEVKLSAMQNVCDTCEKPTAKIHTKNVFSFMDKYAMEHDIITKSYSQFITLEHYETQKPREVFTYEEIATLWELSDELTARIILVYLYTGFRKNELAEMTKENYRDGYLIGGMKTKAGKNRIVPIHHKIKPIIDEFMESDKDTLLPKTSRKLLEVTIPNFCLKHLDKRHILHECRHTFITELNKRHADPICIDRLAGHASGLIGHDIYTHKNLQDLQTAIESILYE